MREIVFDTETTGLSPITGDRLVEIGCVELVNRVETGRTFHAYFNPGRPMHPDAEAVHGLSTAFLSDKPVFAAIVGDLRAFLADGRLVIHNAPFDVGFLNMEYARLGADAPPPIRLEDVVDTLPMARRKHPGAANNLDALCSRYGIDNTRRTKHGALLDAQLSAGHVAGGVGEQECDGAHEVLGPAHLALRNEGDPLLGELGVVIEDLLGAVAFMVSMALLRISILSTILTAQ